jgi:hypothetical protein
LTTWSSDSRPIVAAPATSAEAEATEAGVTGLPASVAWVKDGAGVTGAAVTGSVGRTGTFASAVRGENSPGLDGCAATGAGGLATVAPGLPCAAADGTARGSTVEVLRALPVRPGKSKVTVTGRAKSPTGEVRFVAEGQYIQPASNSAAIPRNNPTFTSVRMANILV